MILATLATFCLYGQNTGAFRSETEVQLNQYELLCHECQELKNKVKAGVSVSRKDASETIRRFVEMNSLIRTMTASMSPEQKIRFEAINIWFSTGERPMVLDHKPMPYVSDIHFKSMPVPYDLSLADSQNDISLTEKAKTENSGNIKTYVLASFSFPESSFGGMIGILHRKWGGYVKAKSNFNSIPDVSYSCFGNGTLVNGGPFWSGGDSRKSHLALSAGALFGPEDWISIYGGLGYGHSYLFWKDIDGKWAQVKDHSFKGPAVEAGILTSWKSLVAGLGISSVSFRTLSFELSLGVAF